MLFSLTKQKIKYKQNNFLKDVKNNSLIKRFIEITQNKIHILNVFIGKSD